jgi:hypothetical protein
MTSLENRGRRSNIGADFFRVLWVSAENHHYIIAPSSSITAP